MYLMFTNNTPSQIQIQFKKMPIAEDVDLDTLATLTAGFSGAEVRVGGVNLDRLDAESGLRHFCIQFH